jgi:L-ascorbate metabolism protein UlaG (beta-lactamase superfamily)
LQKGADLFLYTHAHEDHLDPDFAENFKKLGFGTPIGPKADKSLDIQNITPVKTRHIGKCDIEHISFIITAENKKLWFMGDASPLCLKDFEGECDVIVVPFAYVNTDMALKKTLATGAKDIIVLHMPGKENDDYGLWQAVLKLTADIPSVHILEMGKQITIN